MDSVPQPTHREVIGLQSTSLVVGQSLDHSIRRTISDFDNIAAALLAMNTHPAHTDYAFAANTQFGKPLVVSPFLLSCLVGAAMADLRALDVTDVEIEDLKFTKPVHPGDTIGARSRVTSLDTDRCALDITGMKADGSTFAEFRLLLRLQAKAPGVRS